MHIVRIHRSSPDDDFTIIPNAALRGTRLSYTSRGVLVELLSHMDGWETNADALWRLAHKHRGIRRGEGREAIRAAFAELEQHGYLVRPRVRNQRGEIETRLEIYDTPGSGRRSKDEQLALDYNDRRTASRASVNQTSVDRASVSRTSTRSTNEEELSKEELSQEHSASLANTRAGDSRESPQDDETRLNQLYAAVNRTTPVDLRNALLAFERRRPRIYRQCRRSAIDQVEGKSLGDLKGDQAGHVIDMLSYKYALLHYSPDWPAWLARPLGMQVGKG